MTIAVNPGLAFDIETYDGLVAYITAHLELDATTAAQLPTLIRKAEYRIDRLVMSPERETSVLLATVSGQQSLTLPNDIRHLRNVRIVGDTGQTLDQITLEALHNQYTNDSGKPVAFALHGNQMQLGPVPDAAYTISVSYVSSLPPLTEENQTNWLSLKNADVYVYGTLWQTSAWLEDFDAAISYRQEMMAIIEEINLQGRRQANGAPLTPRVYGTP